MPVLAEERERREDSSGAELEWPSHLPGQINVRRHVAESDVDVVLVRGERSVTGGKEEAIRRRARPIEDRGAHEPARVGGHDHSCPVTVRMLVDAAMHDQNPPGNVGHTQEVQVAVDVGCHPGSRSARGRRVG